MKESSEMMVYQVKEIQKKNKEIKNKKNRGHYKTP